MSVTDQPQHMTALDRANQVRFARAALRVEVAALTTPASAQRVSELLADPPAFLASLSVFDLLCWVRRVGRQEALRILRIAGVGEHRQMREITERQRDVIADRLLLRFG